MSQPVALRSGRDRLRYTIAFEMILMSILVPVGSVLLDKDLGMIGLLGLALMVKAMLMGLAYNWVFDVIYARTGRVSSDRGVLARAVHAVGFELTLVATSLPIYVWWLDLTLLQALAADLVVTSFVVLYTFAFTLAYDRIFPVTPAPARAGAGGPAY